MSFELEHDWQTTFAAPKPRIGEATKIRLLLLLCVLWLGLGLVGHHPWKPDETQSVSIIKHVISSGDWVVMQLSGQPAMHVAPLYYLSAAASAKVFSQWFSMHDAARLVTGFWMALTLLMVGMSGRELWGKGYGRQTTLVFIGSVGLVISAHLLIPDIAGLAGYATAFYGFTLAVRRPLRAGLLLGTGCGIAFLANGLLPAEIIVVTALLLPVCSSYWRSKSYFYCLIVALAATSPWLVLWPFALWQRSPELFQSWFMAMQPDYSQLNLFYFIKTLSWYAWPALPLAGWLLWRERGNYFANPSLLLSLIFFLVLLIMLGFGSDNRDIYALPLLLPLAAFAGSAVDTLRRGAASALDWFGIALYGVLGCTIWLGWFAVMTGAPARLAARMHKLSLSYVPHFEWSMLLAGVVLTLIWLLVVGKAKRSNRAIVTDWAVGITMSWGLLMALWLPLLDANRSYYPVAAGVRAVLPAHYGCINSQSVGESQRAILDYYAGIRIYPLEAGDRLSCDLYLIQDERGHGLVMPGQDWKLVWKGKRASDRRESFRLYQRIAG